MQSVDPVDEDTRRGLLRSVSMAIEITTEILKMNAEHVAQKQEQEWIGVISRQKIQDDIEAEKSKKRLFELQSELAGVQSTGKAIALAKAKSEKDKIDGEAKVSQASLKSQQQKILSQTELEIKKQQKQIELEHQQKKDVLEIARAKRLANIEVEKFQKQIQAIGKETIVAMAKSGPEFQAKLLKGLGLKGFMMMDGKHPINLYNTAQSLISSAANPWQSNFNYFFKFN